MRVAEIRKELAGGLGPAIPLPNFTRTNTLASGSGVTDGRKADVGKTRMARAAQERDSPGEAWEDCKAAIVSPNRSRPTCCGPAAKDQIRTISRIGKVYVSYGPELTRKELKRRA